MVGRSVVGVIRSFLVRSFSSPPFVRSFVRSESVGYPRSVSSFVRWLSLFLVMRAMPAAGMLFFVYYSIYITN